MAFMDNPADPTIDRWLRRHQPRTELALRCCMRGQFDTAKNSAAFVARINELFAAIHPSEAEHAAILRCAREIGSAITKLFNDESGGVLESFPKAHSPLDRSR